MEFPFHFQILLLCFNFSPDIMPKAFFFLFFFSKTVEDGGEGSGIGTEHSYILREIHAFLLLVNLITVFYKISPSNIRV